MAISFTPITFKNTVDGGASMDVNFARAQAAFADGLSRTNSSNNEMQVDLDMNSKEILNVKTDPSNPQSLLNVGEADTRFVQAAGDSMSGDLDMSGNNVKGVEDFRGDNLYLRGKKVIPTNVTDSQAFESVSEMKLAEDLVEGQFVRTLGYYTPGDGGGNDYEIVAGATGTADGSSFIDLDNGLQAESLTDNATTVRIPSDFSSIQQAVDNYSWARGNLGRAVEIVIEAGQELSSGLFVKDGDFSYITISAEDATVFAAALFSGVSTLDIPDRDSGSANNMIVGLSARMPVLACKIDASGSDVTGGYVAANGSVGRVLPGFGISHCGMHGCHAFGGSTINAAQSVFTDCGQDNFRASLSSRIVAQGADGSRGGQHCAQISRNSLAHFQEATLDSGGRRGLRIARSMVNLTNASVKNNAVLDVFLSEGSIVQAEGLETTSGSPSASDFSGIPTHGFNSLSSFGIVFTGSGEATGRTGIVKGSNSYGSWIIYPDNRIKMHTAVTYDPGTGLQNYPFPVSVEIGLDTPRVWFGGGGGSARPTNATSRHRAFIATIVGKSGDGLSWEVFNDASLLDGGVTEPIRITLYAEGEIDFGNITETA